MVFITITNIENIKRFRGAPPPKKSITLTRFIIIILAYSPIKNNANGAPAYSTLYPDTSSDSPSVRSNGARLVSARVEMYHITNRGRRGNNKSIPSLLNNLKHQPPTTKTKGNKINPNLTSYDTVCATPRIAPNKAYFELEAQPDPRTA